MHVLPGASCNVSVNLDGYPPQPVVVLCGRRRPDQRELLLRSDIRVGDVLVGLRLVDFGPLRVVLDFDVTDDEPRFQVEQVSLEGDAAPAA